MRIYRPAHIRWRLFLLLVFTAASLCVAAGGFWVFQIEPALRAQVARSQQEIARFAADRISDFINDRFRQLEAVADIGRLWESSEGRQKEVLHRLLKLSPQIDDVSIIDKNGNEVVRLSRSRTYTDTDLLSLVDEEKFQTPLQGKPYISSVFHARTSEPFVTMAIPIRFMSSDIRGVLTADVSLKTLWNELSDIKVGKSGLAYVIRRNGQLIAHPDYSRVLMGEFAPPNGVIQEFLGGSKKSRNLGEIQTMPSGNQVLMTFQAVPHTQWAVIVEESVDSALAELQQLKKFSGLLFLFTMGAIFAVSFRFSRKISAPIAQLENGVERVMEGELDQRLEIRTGDELETLATKFNQMAVALKESRQGLEAKIAERTRELSTLYAALAPLSPVQSIELIYNSLTERLLEATGADAASIRIRDGNSGPVRKVAAVGFEEAHIEVSNPLRRESMIERVLKTQEPIIACEIETDERIRNEKQLMLGFRSCAFLPLTMAGETRGIIYLASRKTGFFSQEMEAHLMTIARQLGVAAENQTLYAALAAAKEEAQKNLERIRALHNIDVAITSTLELKEVLRLLLEQIDLFLPFAAVPSIALLNTENELEPALCRGVDEDEWKNAAKTSGSRLSRLVFETERPLVVENIQLDSRVGNPAFFMEHNLFSYLGVPLTGSDGVLGVLGLYSRETRCFSDSEIEFMTTLASQAAIAIQNSLLFEKTRLREAEVVESHRFLSALHAVAAAVSRSLDIEQVLKAAIENIRNIFRFDATRIHLFNEASDVLALEQSFETDPARFASTQSFRRGEGIVGTVAESGEALVFEDVQSDLLYAKLSRSNNSRDLGYRFFAVFPIKGKHGSCGTLTCISLDARSLSGREIQLIEAMTDQIAAAVENAGLYKEVKKQLSELELQTAQLQQANQVKDEFLGIMSHELRTPLSVIMGYANLLAEGILGHPSTEQQKALMIIKERTESLSNLMCTILESARIASGSTAVLMEEVNLVNLLRTLEDSYSWHSNDAVSVRWEYDATLPFIMTDSSKLSHILKNLVDNALKFTPGGLRKHLRHIPAGKSFN